MAQYDQQEIENYAFGSPLWAGQNDPVLVEGINDEVFWDSFLSAPGGKAFARLDCAENRATLLKKYAARNSGLIVRSELTALWNMLLIAHNPDFIDPQAEEVAEEVVSPEQEFAEWVEGKSEYEVRQRRSTDKAFSAWFTAMNTAQLRSDDPMASVNVAANIRTERANVSQSLRDFAAEYQKLRVTECKRRLSPATNPAGYAEFGRNLEACFSAGLL
jgi:hypothetical protein